MSGLLHGLGSLVDKFPGCWPQKQCAQQVRFLLPNCPQSWLDVGFSLVWRAGYAAQVLQNYADTIIQIKG
eukprot:10330850-Lingulodinium_polyedra.AAC.1